MPKPHSAFEYSRADEVAECWDGIPQIIYIFLWDIIVPLQSPIPNLEDSGPHDHIGHENLASHWSLLPEDYQWYLNSLAIKREAEWDAEMAKYRLDNP